jgi:hypothetical protein
MFNLFRKMKRNGYDKYIKNYKIFSIDKKIGEVESMLIIFADYANMFDEQQINESLDNYYISRSALIYKCYLKSNLTREIEDMVLEGFARYLCKKYKIDYNNYNWQVITARSKATGKRSLLLCSRSKNQ